MTRNDRGARPGQRPVPFARSKSKRRTRLVTGLIWVAFIVASSVASGIWLSYKANTISVELKAVSQLLPRLKDEVVRNDTAAAAATVESLTAHTSRARAAGNDPLWIAAGEIPWIGANFSATRAVTTAADDVATLGAKPLLGALSSMDWTKLAPGPEGIDSKALVAAEPKIVSAAHTFRQTSNRLKNIDVTKLLPQVREPLVQAREQLEKASAGLDSAAQIASLTPDMLGTHSPRQYLLLIQNNAEARATGGIAGALAVLSLDKGRLSLGAQSSADEMGVASPSLTVEAEQQHIYSARLGKFIQDVNLTPDFPTAASNAQAMWEKKFGQRVDGVIAIDPVALSYVLKATGPVTVSSPELASIAGVGLPEELNSQNVVRTLVSDVYAKIEQPSLQDIYFAGVAQEIFHALSRGQGDAKGLIQALARATDEGRVRVWSGQAAEQSVIATYPLGGSIDGPSVSPAQFGVYFNDGTGAKMDYYVKRTVQLIKECPREGYEQTTVRVTSTNTAPTDAATKLPAYVTGGGNFGVPPGSVQTNLVAYGPVQANVEMATLDGKKTEFAPYIHSNRPVGMLAIRLAPGESRTVDFTFGKIVQHTAPNVVVTPTLQNVKDVILPTENRACG